MSGTDGVRAGVLPAGRYAVVLYTGPYDQSVSVTATLLAWAEEHAVRWKMNG